METNPSSLSSEPVPTSTPLPEIQKAVDLTQSYVDRGVKQVETITQIIGGEQASMLGVNANSIKLALMFIGFIVSWKYVTTKAKDKWPYVIGGLLGITVLRNTLGKKSTPAPAKNA